MSSKYSGIEKVGDQFFINIKFEEKIAFMGPYNSAREALIERNLFILCLAPQLQENYSNICPLSLKERI